MPIHESGLPSPSNPLETTTQPVIYCPPPVLLLSARNLEQPWEMEMCVSGTGPCACRFGARMPVVRRNRPVPFHPVCSQTKPGLGGHPADRRKRGAHTPIPDTKQSYALEMLPSKGGPPLQTSEVVLTATLTSLQTHRRVHRTTDPNFIGAANPLQFSVRALGELSDVLNLI